MPDLMLGRRPARQGRIVNDLRQLILRCELRPGQPLPPLDDMQAEYDVPRHTVQRAYAFLASEGLAAQVHRSGWQVADTRPEVAALHRVLDALDVEQPAAPVDIRILAALVVELWAGRREARRY